MGSWFILFPNINRGLFLLFFAKRLLIMRIRNFITILGAIQLAAMPLMAQIDTSSTVVVVAGQEAAIAYNKGLTEANAGQLAMAISDFTESVSANPKFSKAYYNRGVVHLEGFSALEALRDFDSAIKLEPRKANYHLGRAIALARIARYQEALESIKTADRLGYSPTAIKYFYGYIYYLQGNYTQAIGQYNDAISKNPKFAYAYCDRASAHLKAGNVKAAMDDYTTALTIMPDAYFVYLLRADAKAAQGNFNGAIQDINIAMKMVGDDNFDILNARGVMYGRAGKYQKAMTDFNAAIAKNPQSPAPYILIGNMMMAQKKYPEAEAQFSKALDIDSANIAAYHNRANARELQFRLADAKADRDMADRLNQESTQYKKQ